MKDICVREVYTDKDGTEKVSFRQLGVLFVGKNGKEYVKLYHIPNTLLSVLEQKKKDIQPTKEELPTIDESTGLPF